MTRSMEEELAPEEDLAAAISVMSSSLELETSHRWKKSSLPSS